MITLTDIAQIKPSRTFNGAYIVLDLIYLLFLIGLLIYQKKFLTLIWSIIGGLLYLGVDFGIFYCLTHTREITINGQLLDTTGHFFTLLWFSFSYGVPNFIFIWEALSHDKHLKLYTLIIVGWWLVVPTLSQIGSVSLFENTFMNYVVTTSRQTCNFHWVMGLFLIIGYTPLIVYYLTKDQEHLKENIKNLLYLNLIGILTQFMWEAPLLINGIRPLNELSLQTLIVNSLIETNSGMVYFYLLHKFVTKKRAINEDLTINH